MYLLKWGGWGDGETLNSINKAGTESDCCTSNFTAKMFTVNFLNIRTPKKFVVITLKFELCGANINS